MSWRSLNVQCAWKVAESMHDAAPLKLQPIGALAVYESFRHRPGCRMVSRVINSSAEQSRPAERPGNGWRTPGSAICRAAGFFCFWLVLTGADADDLAAGLVAAVVATWASLGLMPAQQGSLRPIKLAGFFLHFLRQSIVAGMDVARRALDPRLRLQPGFVVYQGRLPPGTARDAFCAIMSLLPGTLPCGPAENDGLTVHCLDVTEPVAEQLAAEEALYMQTLGGAPRNG